MSFSRRPKWVVVSNATLSWSKKGRTSSDSTACGVYPSNFFRKTGLGKYRPRLDRQMSPAEWRAFRCLYRVDSGTPSWTLIASDSNTPSCATSAPNKAIALSKEDMDRATRISIYHIVIAIGLPRIAVSSTSRS